jgi:hypothetical protein
LGNGLADGSQGRTFRLSLASRYVV